MTSILSLMQASSGRIVTDGLMKTDLSNVYVPSLVVFIGTEGRGRWTSASAEGAMMPLSAKRIALTIGFKYCNSN